MHKRLNPQDNLQTSLLLNNLGCIHRDSGDYDKALDLDEHSSPIPLEECISHQEQDALMRRNASAEIKAAFGIDKTMLHFSEVKS